MLWISSESRSDCLILDLLDESKNQGCREFMELQKKKKLFCVSSHCVAKTELQSLEKVVAVITIIQLTHALSISPSCYSPCLWRQRQQFKSLFCTSLRLLSTCHWLLFPLTFRFLVPYSSYCLPASCLAVFSYSSLVKVCSPSSSVPWCFWARESFCHLLPNSQIFCHSF